jgi:hypothetical protein
MRKVLAVAAAVLTSTLFTASAFAQGAPAAGAAPPAAAADDKKIGVGLDAQFLLPVGDLADGTGPFIGALLRFGYRVMPELEATARVGYLYGLGKDVGGGSSVGISDIPVWVGARYFILEPSAGLYAGAEIGANILKPHISPTPPSNPITDKALESRTRFGFNLGVGYVVSKELPIDIRAQLSHLNLLGTESGEKAALGIGISAGYTLQF